MPIQTPGWVRDAVFYQVFPDRFAASARVSKPGPLERWDAPPTHHGFKGGDLLGVVEHLDHIQAVGANALYLNPIFSSASNHRYHTYDYMQVDPLLGGDAAFRELLDACHERGMHVIIDGVFNHASRGFWPFHHVMETGYASPYRDWFRYDLAALQAGRQLRAYSTEAELAAAVVDVSHDKGDSAVARLGYEAWWGLPALPKLNTDTPDVRAYLYGVAEHWIRFGADGWRLDVPLEIRDEEFWREFRRRVRALDPEAYILAEVWHEEPRYLQGDQYDAYMNYPLTLAILNFTAGRHLDIAEAQYQSTYARSTRRIDGPQFARDLERVSSLYDPAVTAVQFNLLSSHDTPRFRTLAGGDTSAVRMAVLVQMTLPGAPSIYYGDEIGMEGAHDPDCRRSFPWERPDAWDAGVLEFTRRATAARHANPTLRAAGRLRLVGAMDETAAYVRWDDRDLFVVALNAGDDAASLRIDIPELGERALRLELCTDDATPATVQQGTGKPTLVLPPRGGWLLRAVPAA